MNRDELVKVIESIFLVAPDPVSTADLAVLLEAPKSLISDALAAMSESYNEQNRGIVLREVAGGWRFSTNPDSAPYLERFASDQAGVKLSQAALETLAVIAYRQPVSRGQLSEIRGVNSDRAVTTLLLKGLIEETGRQDDPGRAALFATTSQFLERVGLNDLSQLPELASFMPKASEVERLESGLGPAT